MRSKQYWGYHHVEKPDTEARRYRRRACDGVSGVNRDGDASVGRSACRHGLSLVASRPTRECRTARSPPMRGPQEWDTGECSANTLLAVVGFERTRRGRTRVRERRHPDGAARALRFPGAPSGAHRVVRLESGLAAPRAGPARETGMAGGVAAAPSQRLGGGETVYLRVARGAHRAGAAHARLAPTALVTVRSMSDPVPAHGGGRRLGGAGDAAARAERNR